MVEQTEADEKHTSGHVFSLNAEQKDALKEMWKKYLRFTSDAAGHDAPNQAHSSNGTAQTASGTNAAPPTAHSSSGDKSGKESAKAAAKDDASQAQSNAAAEAEGLQELMDEHGAAEVKKAFWTFCMGEDPDALMLRFLRARSWDTAKAFNMLASTIKWRIESKVADIIAAGEEGLCKHQGVKKNLSMAKCYFHGTDKQSRPVIYARVKHHKASDQTQDEMLKYIVLNMETSRVLTPVRANIETASVVFDMTGFGLSNMDWDTATMVIKIFQSYYPETLGHAIVYNAPTVFSAVWKIVKPMLDPAVREKVHFAGNAAEMAKLIDPSHLEKDFGGASSWRYRFQAPPQGENEHMQDEETKAKRVKAYREAADKWDEATKRWIGGDESAYKERRERLVKEVDIRQLDLDPYVRGQTVFTRDGTVVGDGTVVWRYDHGRTEEYGKSADEWAQELGIEDPAKRPRNKAEAEITLSTDEDTESETDDSENEILADPHHHHHNAVAVGFAKVGDNIGNKFSKIGKGPSLHEKKRRQKEERHKRHEESRARKIEEKRKRLEAEQRRQEEEEDRQRREEEEDEAKVNASYSGYLAKMGNLSLAAGNKAADYVPSVLGGNYLKSATSTGEA